MDKDTVLFKNTSFSDVLKEIYTNSKRKDRTLTLLIADLRPLVKTIDDAVTMLPLISQYLTISVKNDELLVKMAAIASKLMSASDDSIPYDISPAEMKKIEAKADELRQQTNILKHETKKIVAIADADDDEDEVI